MGLDKQGAKPTGALGSFIGRMMNLFHTGFYKKYYNKILPAEQIQILDIGCGGGSFIKFLAKKDKNYKVFGIDHSEEMAELSKKVNKSAIRKGQVEIVQGSVLELPYLKDSIDFATAHETVQFWPDIERAFSEIYRVLNVGGKFIIINRYPEKGSKWWNMAKLKSKDDFEKAFEKAGFKSYTVDIETRKGWIITNAEK